MDILSYGNKNTEALTQTKDRVWRCFFATWRMLVAYLNSSIHCQHSTCGKKVAIYFQQIPSSSKWYSITCPYCETKQKHSPQQPAIVLEYTYQDAVEAKEI